MNTPTTHLYLIRHGEADGDLVDGPQGDPGLSALGRQQVVRLRDRLQATGEITPDAVLSSTLPRARQTAEILAPTWGVPIQYDDELQELRVGEADGLPEEEFRARYGPPDLARNPFRLFAPGGENWGGFVLRVASALDRIIRAHDKQTVVLICHGGIIDAAFLYFFRMNTLTLPPAGFYTYNTAITHWRLDELYGAPRWRLMCYNDDLHLRDTVRWVAATSVEGDEQAAVPELDEE